MIRKLTVLGGLSIIAVLVNHAISQGLLAMIWWTDRFRPVTPPNYDYIGTPVHLFFELLQNLTVFSVPAFILISGYFASYAIKGARNKSVWYSIKKRIIGLLIPYLIWSVFYLVFNYINDKTIYTIPAIFKMVFLTGTNGALYFVPLLIYLYLLSPWIFQLAKNHPKALILGCIIIPFFLISLHYPYSYFGFRFPGLSVFINITPWQLPIYWILFFSTGMILEMYPAKAREWLNRLKWYFLGIAFISFLVIFFEDQIFYNLNHDNMTTNIFRPFFIPYTFTFIISFLAFEKVKIPFTKQFIWLGGKTYGIYFVHLIVLIIIPRIIYHVFPMLFSIQLLFQPLLVIILLIVPLIFMEIIARSRVSSLYPYLFG